MNLHNTVIEMGLTQDPISKEPDEITLLRDG
jgi:hypothetical protein